MDIEKIKWRDGEPTIELYLTNTEGIIEEIKELNYEKISGLPLMSSARLKFTLNFYNSESSKQIIDAFYNGINTEYIIYVLCRPRLDNKKWGFTAFEKCYPSYSKYIDQLTLFSNETVPNSISFDNYQGIHREQVLKLIGDGRYEEKTITDLYNTICPICNSLAYQGIGQIECSRGCNR